MGVVFLTLIGKLIPLYVFIGGGFLANKYLKWSPDWVAKVLIYVLAPVVIFNAVFMTPLTAQVFYLPIFFFLVCSMSCLVTFVVAKKFWKDRRRNILAFTAGAGNVGYFGLPVAVTLFGPSVAGPIAAAIVGFLLYENSVGFFITARGHHTWKESVLKIAQFPTLYAFGGALIFSLMGLKTGENYAHFATIWRNLYAMLGMTLIGLSLTKINWHQVDKKFIASAFLIKFVLWPAGIFIVSLLDNYWLHFFTPQIRQVMMIISVVPLAVNTVTYATELKAYPEKAAFAVLLSTIFALMYMPLLAAIFLH